MEDKYNLLPYNNDTPSLTNEEKLKTIFKNFLDSNYELNLKGFRNFFFYLGQKEINIYEILKKFGYNEISNNDCRNFFLSFHTNELIDVRLSDGNNNRFTSYAYEVYLKQIGTIMNIKNNKYINLIYDQTRDFCNIMLMLENKSENEKKVTLDIECNGYVSLNGFKYKTVLKAKEYKYLFAIAIDKNINEHSQKSMLIEYNIFCE
jgi:hypothetical protein